MRQILGILFALISINCCAHAQILYVDPNADGTSGLNWRQAFKNLQDAIEAARPCDEIRIAKGTYKPDSGYTATPGDRNASFIIPPAVIIKGGYAGLSSYAEPDLRNFSLYKTILTGDLAENDNTGEPSSKQDNCYHVLICSNLNADTILEGLIITGGNAADAPQLNSGAALYNINASPTIRHCIFFKNVAGDAGGAIFNHDHSNPKIINCNIYGNYTQNCGAAIHNCPTSNAMIKNCIIWNNFTYNTCDDLSRQLSGSIPDVTYSCIQNWTGDLQRANIKTDPLFADPSTMDFHLRSQAGRFQPLPQNLSYPPALWVLDKKTSPCINAGDPYMNCQHEPPPNGRRINIGAYGGTNQASLSRWQTNCDFNSDLTINFTELKTTTQTWLYSLPWADNNQTPVTDPPLIFHVDGSGGSNFNDGLTRKSAFRTINKAVAVAENGDKILVWPGIYQLDQPLDFLGKAIKIKSAADPAILTCPHGIAVEFNSAEGPNSVLANFVITNSSIAIYIISDRPALKASPTLTNLTVAGNYVGLYADDISRPAVSNCIFYDNSDLDLICSARTSVRYSCIQDGFTGIGNITDSPLFADPPHHDYHLRSENGRFIPQNSNLPQNLHSCWVLDKINSPCIDAGNPQIIPLNELITGGGRINMGAYGNTGYASRSQWLLKADSNRDGIVNIIDFATLADNWLKKAPWLIQ